MKNKVYIGLLIIYLILFSGCGTNNNYKNTIKQVSNNINTINHDYYEIIDKDYSNNGIKIQYPQIKNMSDIDKQNNINNLIKNEALKVLNYYSGEDKFTLNINYIIKYKSPNMLSIQYSGVGNIEGATHPNNLCYTTNIDINKGTKLRLKDLIIINNYFVKKFNSGEFKTVNSEQQILLEEITQEDLVNYLINADSLDNIGTETQSDTFSYFTKDALGISFAVGHAAGDHVEFEIKYKDIEDNLKAENRLWESFK